MNRYPVQRVRPRPLVLGRVTFPDGFVDPTRRHLGFRHRRVRVGEFYSRVVPSRVSHRRRVRVIVRQESGCGQRL